MIPNYTLLNRILTKITDFIERHSGRTNPFSYLGNAGDVAPSTRYATIIPDRQLKITCACLRWNYFF